MDEVNDISDVRQIVRAYSFEAERRLPQESEAHALAHILAGRQGNQEDARDPWRRFFEPLDSSEASDNNPITEVLAVETKQLREKWKAFVESSPTRDRLNLRASEPTMNGVIGTVQEIQRTWESKRNNGRLARSKRLFHKFCGTLHSHKLLLEILPSGNEYVSIFTGTLNAVIQASANHEKVTEGLSEALCSMSQHVEDCKTDLELFNMEDMQRLIVDLYAHIFLLLTSVMDWMMKKRIKRLLDSFNDDLPSVFENEMRKIKAISDRIRNLAAQKARAELRYTRLTAEDSARDIRVGLEGNERHQAEMKHYAERILREQGRAHSFWTAEKQEQLADNIVNMLEQRAIMWLGANRAHTKSSQPFSTAALLSLDRHESQVSEYKSEEIAISSRHLEDYFHRDRVRLPGDAFDPVKLQPEALGQIGDWAKAPPPKILWFEGPPLEADDFDNPVTMTAATFIELAEQTQLPIVSYFCELRRGETQRPGNDSREAQAMLCLVYALIRQLIELLPPVLETSVKLSESRFQSLDGSLGTWSLATSVLNDLSGLIPGPVFCVIDGFHWLSSRSTDGYLSDLLKVLRGDRWKVLLCTTGRSAVLRDELSRSETFSINVQSLGRGVALNRQDCWAAVKSLS